MSRTSLVAHVETPRAVYGGWPDHPPRSGRPVRGGDAAGALAARCPAARCAIRAPAAAVPGETDGTVVGAAGAVRRLLPSFSPRARRPRPSAAGAVPAITSSSSSTGCTGCRHRSTPARVALVGDRQLRWECRRWRFPAVLIPLQQCAPTNGRRPRDRPCVRPIIDRSCHRLTDRASERPIVRPRHSAVRCIEIRTHAHTLARPPTRAPARLRRPALRRPCGSSSRLLVQR